MRQPTTDNEILRDKMLKEVESWGILTLMTRMKDSYLNQLNNERRILSTYTMTYKDSSLENLDKLMSKFEEVYDREFKKIYKDIERKHEAKD
jgi:hypothetical protein